MASSNITKGSQGFCLPLPYTNICLIFVLSGMGNIRVPFKGISNDYKGRAPCYKQDWTGAHGSGVRYFLFASEHATWFKLPSLVMKFFIYSPFDAYQDIGSNFLYILCFCPSRHCLWGAIE